MEKIAIFNDFYFRFERTHQLWFLDTQSRIMQATSQIRLLQPQNVNPSKYM